MATNDQTTTVTQTCECFPAIHIPCSSDSVPVVETWEQAKNRVLKEHAKLWKELAQL